MFSQIRFERHTIPSMTKKKRVDPDTEWSWNLRALIYRDVGWNQFSSFSSSSQWTLWISKDDICDENGCQTFAPPPMAGRV